MTTQHFTVMYADDGVTAEMDGYDVQGHGRTIFIAFEDLINNLSFLGDYKEWQKHSTDADTQEKP